MTERTTARTGSARGPRNGRARRGALLLLTLGLLAGCGPLGPGAPSEPSAEGPTLPATPTGIRGQDADDEAYGEACNGEGAYSVDSSAERTLDDAPLPDGTQLAVSLGYTAEDGPRARLSFSTSGEPGAHGNFDGEVGESSRYDAWTITIRSICDGEVGFDVDEA